MTHLGSFGAAVRELDPAAERDTFDFFGEKFVVIDVAPPILMMQVAAGLNGKVDDTEAMAAMWALWSVCLGRDEFTRFYRLAVEHRCDLESLVKVALALFQVQDGRPTVTTPGSSAGASTTSPSSSPSSTHPALAHMRPVSAVVSG